MKRPLWVLRCFSHLSQPVLLLIITLMTQLKANYSKEALCFCAVKRNATNSAKSNYTPVHRQSLIWDLLLLLFVGLLLFFQKLHKEMTKQERVFSPSYLLIDYSRALGSLAWIIKEMYKRLPFLCDGFLRTRNLINVFDDLRKCSATNPVEVISLMRNWN